MTFFLLRDFNIPGPPKEPKIMAQYRKTESIGSIGSIISAILEVQVQPKKELLWSLWVANWRSTKAQTPRPAIGPAPIAGIALLGLARHPLT